MVIIGAEIGIFSGFWVQKQIKLEMDERMTTSAPHDLWKYNNFIRTNEEINFFIDDLAT